jgi:glutamate dehydrogenase
MALRAQAAENGIIRQVTRALGKGSPAAALAELLYGRKLHDDLAAASADWLAGNVREALDFIAEKPKGRHKIRLRRVPAGRGSDEGSVIEILNNDMPFLVDSVLGELQARGLGVRFLFHPIFKVRRDKAGHLQEIAGPGDANWGDGQQESYIAIHTKPLSDSAGRDLVAAISAILGEVRLVVADWAAMLARLRAAITQLEVAPPGVPADLLGESIAFLKWLEAGNFTFLGSREYELSGDAETGDLIARGGPGLGVLRDHTVHVLRRGTELVAMTPEVRRFFFARAPLIITKANVLSRVHRRAHMDYVGIKTYAADGKTRGEIRFVGLFTSQAYVRSPVEIPFLRHKVARVIETSGHPPASHDGKALLNILDTFPRDELFQIGAAQLQEWAEGILELETRPRVKVFARVDRFDRFVSLLVFVPRDRYNTHVRERIGALFAEAYQGRVSAFYPYFPEGPLVRVQFIIGRYEGTTPTVDASELERQVADIVRTWDDRLADAIAGLGARADGLQAKYGAAFSPGYAETFPAKRALEDIERIERLGPDRPIAIDFYREVDAPARCPC